MSAGTRRWAAGVAGVLGLALAVDAALWWVATGRMAQAEAAWVQGLTAQGYAVSAGAARRGGWPWQAELTVPDFQVATGAPGQPDAAAWHVGDVRLTLSPWQPALLIVSLGRDQSVQLSTAPAFAFQAEALGATVPLTQSGQADGVVVQGSALAWPGGGMRRLTLRLRPLAAELTVAGLAPASGAKLPFGGTIDTLEVQAAVNALPPPVRDWNQAAAAWRDAGGRVTIAHAAMRWGPLDLDGSGTLSLDGGLQPAGAFTLQASGYREAIEALVRSGAMTRSQAQVAGTLLALVSRPGADGSPQAELPVRLQDGVVSAGPAPLLRLPKISLP